MQVSYHVCSGVEYLWVSPLYAEFLSEVPLLWDNKASVNVQLWIDNL